MKPNLTALKIRSCYKMSRKLLSFAGALVCGVWCGGFFTAASLPIIYLVLVLLFVVSCWSIYCQKRLWVFIGFFFMLGMFRVIHAASIPAHDISNFAEQNVKVQGRVVDVPQATIIDEKQRKVKYTLQVNKLIHGREYAHASGGVAVNHRQEFTEALPRCGDELVVCGKVYLPHGYNNPGLPDTVGSLARQGITARMAVTPGSIKVVDNYLNSWDSRIAVWRNRVFENMQKVMPANEAGILNGFIFGGYTGIKSEIVKAYAVTGIIHILSVSGTHIALVGGILTWLGTAVGLRRYTGILACSGVVFYSVISGLSPPVVRSALMGIIAFSAVWLGREKDSPTAFAIATIGMIGYEPSLIWDISFQLSFGATAGLIFLYSKVRGWFRLPAGIAGPLAVTISAQLGVLPFIAWYFSGVSLSSVIANIIIVPIVELVVIIGLLGVILGSASYFAGQMIFVLCSLIIGFINWMVLLLAELPGGYIHVPAGNMYVGLIYYLFLAWIFGYLPANFLKPQEMFERWPGAGLLFIGCTLLGFMVYSLWPRPVYVHFIDVGQGDATLVTTPHHYAILIDTGGNIGDTTGFDIGERVVVPYLQHYGVTKLDYLILTHGHQDHAGGALGVVNNITVKNILLPRENFTSSVRDLIRTHPQGIVPTYEGQSIIIDGVKIAVVHAVSPHQYVQGNEVSSVIRVEYGQNSFLLTGDLNASGEGVMLKRFLNRVDVLKVGHHGSKTSSTAPFLEALSPKYAIISVGYKNRFGHPHAETLQRLAQHNIRVFRTDERGAIIASTDGVRLNIASYK